MSQPWPFVVAILQATYFPRDVIKYLYNKINYELNIHQTRYCLSSIFCFRSELLGSNMSSYEELKYMIPVYETETISKNNLLYGTANFSKDSKQRQCAEHAQILMDKSQYFFLRIINYVFINFISAYFFHVLH